MYNFSYIILYWSRIYRVQIQLNDFLFVKEIFVIF